MSSAAAVKRATKTVAPVKVRPASPYKPPRALAAEAPHRARSRRFVLTPARGRERAGLFDRAKLAPVGPPPPLRGRNRHAISGGRPSPHATRGESR